MMIYKDKKAVTVILGLSALAVLLISFHGCSVTTYGEVKLASLAITPANSSVAGNSTQQFTVMGVYTNGSQQALTEAVTWSSSNTAVATIDATTGLATAADVASTQQCTITVTLVSDSAITGSTTLTVKKMNLQSITVTPATATIAIGTLADFSADGLFSDGIDSLHQDLTSQATWTISDTNIATIAAGRATGVSAGTVTITASSAGITSNSTSLTVSNLTVQSITITAAISWVEVGFTRQLTATGTLNDNSTTQDLTSQALWSSSDTAVATVNSLGLVTGVKVGTATITAQAAGKTGSYNVTVKAPGGHN